MLQHLKSCCEKDNESGQQRNANILLKVVAAAQCATWDNVVYVWQGSISYSQSGHEWIQKSFVDPKNNLRTKISCDTPDYWVIIRLTQTACCQIT